MTKEHDLMMSKISDAGLDATDHDPAETADSIAMETAKRFQELLHSPALREYPADKLVEACRDGDAQWEELAGDLFDTEAAARAAGGE